jgi:hypothetical protein
LFVDSIGGALLLKAATPLNTPLLCHSLCGES